MSSLFNIIGTHKDQLTSLPIMISVVVAMTILLFILFRKITIMKYVPGLVFSVIGLYYLYIGYRYFVEPRGVSALWQFTIFFVAGFCGLCIGLILGIWSGKQSRDAEKGGEGSEPADDRRAVSPIRKMLDRRAEKNAKQKAEASGRKSGTKAKPKIKV